MTDEQLIHHFAMLREQQRCRDKAKPYTQNKKELEDICRRLEAKVDAAIKERNQRIQRELEEMQPDLGLGYFTPQEEN